MSNPSETVVVLGASPKPDRYANKAFHLLREHGHEVIPVHPALAELDGVPVVKRLEDIDEAVDTVTVYVGETISAKLTDALIALHPKRVIFNPGAENPALMQALDAEGIATEEACTLVLLNTGQF
ncbi:MAG: putative CoA-binding protein [Kiritimatiellia bacterium]|jgi:predicted CoA-binding protein